MAFCKHRVMDKCKKDNRPCIYSKECCEPEEKKITNADRIRNMTDEELAEFLSEVKYDGIYYAEGQDYPMKSEVWIEWIQAEAKEGNSNENT